MTNCYSEGNISGTSGVGGLIGIMQHNNNVIQNCYSAANVTAGGDAGGIVGMIYPTLGITGSITNCYATGNITASSRAGGLIGTSTFPGLTVTDCYAAGGVITSIASPGGFQASGSVGTYIDNFYDNNKHTTAGVAVDASINPQPTANWDTNVWDLSEDFPTLKNYGASFCAKERYSESIQIGQDTNSSSQINVATAFKLGLNDLKFAVDTQADARATITKINKLIESLTSLRSSYGSQINKLTSILGTIDSRIQGYGETKSNIMDTDMAKVQSGYLKTQILQNFSTSLYKQATRMNKDIVLGLLS